MNDAIDTELPEQVGTMLRERGETLSVAESCTGGLLGGAITAVPGSSDYFEAGLTTYSNDAKQRLLGVSRESLDADGAVSEAVAREMATGVRDVTGATWGVSTTGVAGPDGGTAEKPVGTVYIGVAYAGPWGSGRTEVSVSRCCFDGDRSTVRVETVEEALSILLESIDRRDE